jgi:hypothetical protein
MSKTFSAFVEERLAITNELSHESKVVGQAISESESAYRIKLTIQPLSRFYLVSDRVYRGMYVLFAGRRERSEGRPPLYFGRIGWAIRVQGQECLELYFPDIQRSYYLWLATGSAEAAPEGVAA